MMELVGGCLVCRCCACAVRRDICTDVYVAVRAMFAPTRGRVGLCVMSCSAYGSVVLLAIPLIDAASDAAGWLRY